MTATTRRITGASIALAATLTLSGPLVLSASAEPVSNPAQSAAHYLQQQLTDGGNHFSVESDFGPYVDYGVTADAILALAAAGTGQAGARPATAYLAGNVVGYTGFGDPDEVYAGPVAKLLNVAVVQGVNPRDFGGTDLVATLEALEVESGRFSDDSEFGDYSNTFGQSLALIGLKRAGVNPSAASIDFLGEQQCPGGGFQLYMDDAPCTDDANSDPDATALAVQALIAVDGGSARINAGLDYLSSKQGTDGGVGGGAPQTAPNANSTGLAGQAFLAGGRTAQAALASDYIVGLQYGCESPEDLRGGIAYDPAALAEQKAKGADAVPVDQDRRSTTQALLALAGTPLYAVTATGASDTAPSLSCETTSPLPPVTTPPVVGPVIETDIPQSLLGLGARGLLR
ncbi:MAG: hypothetical protein ABR500_03695 [Dermatophilaceae bacterium]